MHLEGPKEWVGQFIMAKVTEAQTWYIKAESIEQDAQEAVS